ncbi:TPA: hypothetical protein HA246_02420 [Candidatus Woesearchaeota archaeon]|nr:hypothetical protein [Candidatus Woesearchaeota archaeon]
MKHINIVFISVILALLIFLVSCTNNNYIEATGNFHTHTLASFDSNETYEAIIDEAGKLGFDFIVITDHNEIDENIKEKCLNEKRLLCIQGLEITPFKGHIVVVDFGKDDKETAIDPKTKPEEVIKQIHNAGGIAIAAHPLAENGGFTLEEISKLNFDAMECYIPRNKQQFPAIKPCVYSSDAHNAEQLKDAFSVCKVEDKNGNKKVAVEEIKNAVKDGNCKKAE